MARAISEHEAWTKVQSHALRILERKATPSIHDAAERIRSWAEVMLAQLDQGLHENPPLAIWANPKNPATLRITFSEMLSRRVYNVQYKHVTDGQDYEHPFGPGVDLVSALTNDGGKIVVLVGRQGQDLWADF